MLSLPCFGNKICGLEFDELAGITSRHSVVKLHGPLPNERQQVPSVEAGFSASASSGSKQLGGSQYVIGGGSMTTIAAIATVAVVVLVGLWMFLNKKG